VNYKLPDGYTFAPMNGDDVDGVIQVIRRHNSEDAEAAGESFQRSIEGLFVLKERNAVMGVTGAKLVPETDRSYWLSWTYLSPSSSMRIDRGRILFELICGELTKLNARKLFAAISPDVDSPLGRAHLVGGAEAEYLDFGFEREAIHEDYYLPGESMTVLSYRLQPWQSAASETENHGLQIHGLQITDADEIEETDDAYFLDWQFIETSDPELAIQEMSEQIEPWLAKIRDWEGRMSFIGIPSTAEFAIQLMTSIGFYEDGRLKDFHADGVDEVRLRFDL
jgi:hypothetical protein